MYFEHIVGYAAEKDRIDGIVKIIDSGEKNLLKSTRSPLKIAIVGDLEIANLFLDYLISQISVPYIKLFRDEQLPSPNELSHYKVICINEAHDLGLSSRLLSPSAVLIAILDKKSSDFEKIMTEITIDEIIEIGNPGFEFRLNMLKDELDTRIGEIKDQTLNFVAEITEGWSVSKIHQLIKKILLKTLDQNKAALTCEDILCVFEELVFGSVNSTRQLDAFERKIIATHEVGHLIVSIACVPDEILYVGINPCNDKHANFMAASKKDGINSMKKIESRIDVLLAGRENERLFYPHERFMGSHNDIKKATQTAKDLVSKSGCFDMDYFYEFSDNFFSQYVVSNKKLYSCEKMWRKVLRDSEKRTRKLLKKNKRLSEVFVNELMHKSFLTKYDIRNICEKYKFKR